MNQIYKLFKEKQGAEHIASPVSIEKIVELAGGAKNILEFGAGIGTLTYATLKSTDAFIEIYEDNEFCIEKLRENLKEYADRYVHIGSYNCMPRRKKYDLIIVDGGKGGDDGGVNNWISMMFRNYLEPPLMYFEGGRAAQRKQVRNMLTSRYICKIERVVSRDGFKGGTVMRFTPSCSYIQKFLNKMWCDFREHRRMEWLFGYIKPPEAG